MKRPLTPEEKKLWKFVTRNDKRLAKEAETETANISTPQSAVDKNTPRPLAIKAVLSGGASSLPNKAGTAKPTVAGKTTGDYAGVDRNTAERFRRGEYPIDATLDLHGMSRDKAHAAFVRFVAGQVEKKSRCLLVITGKGTRTKNESGQARGVLKELLPLWISLENVQPWVLAFDKATPKHGGSGAYYILLKRKR